MANLVSLCVGHLVCRDYSSPRDTWELVIYGRKQPKLAPTSKRVKWEKDKTYTIIFGPTQHEELKIFKENCGGFDILYESRPAKNTRYPDTGNRNTLIIFEVNLRFFEAPDS